MDVWKPELEHLFNLTKCVKLWMVEGWHVAK